MVVLYSQINSTQYGFLSLQSILQIVQENQMVGKQVLQEFLPWYKIE